MTPRSFLTHVCALAASAMFVAPALAQNALDEIVAKKSITIAIPTDSAPYGYVGTDLQPQGLDIDMANLIGAKLGVKVELLPVCLLYTSPSPRD